MLWRLDHPSPLRFAVFAVAAVCGCSLGAVAGRVDPSASVLADVLVPPPGVADQGADPAVVGLVAAGAVVCSGVLLAEDLVLTAGHCVAAATCSAGSASSGAAGIAGSELSVDPGAGSSGGAAGPPPLSVLVGEGAWAMVRAGVRSLELPDGGDPCAPDLVLLWLDAPVRDVVPLSIKVTGTAAGDHVRVVEFGPGPAAMAPVARVFDHVYVGGSGPTRMDLELGPCAFGCGGPVLDEASAEVTGIVLGSHPGPDAAPPIGDVGAFDVAARVDPWVAWLQAAVARSDHVAAAGARPTSTRKGPVDLGAACRGAIDCAAGVCVRQAGREYCSRGCSAHDRCPARSRCGAAPAGNGVCVLE